jgi:8-oxo-dGTP diphosphatase
MKHISVVAAIIVYNQKILCVQRGANKYTYISHKWEFPGGKIEVGESKDHAIIREIDEELGLKITVEREYITVQHQYNDFHITMHSFICNCDQLNIHLTEHIDFKWLNVNELSDLDWAAADIPIVKAIKEEHATK